MPGTEGNAPAERETQPTRPPELTLGSEGSLRLAVLRFSLIVGVVFIHAKSTTLKYSFGSVGVVRPHAVADYTINLISEVVCRTAVPLFFLFSGYLFFAGFEGSAEGYRRKFRARFGSLLVPYLFWNTATLLAILVFQKVPATQPLFSGGWYEVRTGPGALVRSLLGVGRMPISYQFWFVRDLMLLVLVTPILAALLRAGPRLLIAGLLICWLGGVWPLYAPSSEASLFFVAGCFLGSVNANLFSGDRYGGLVIAAYAAWAGVEAALLVRGAPTFHLHRLGLLLGVAAALSASKPLARATRLGPALLWLGNSSFFVYAAHEPLLTAVRKIAYRALRPESGVLILCLYLGLPLLVIAFLIAAHRVLSRLFPGLIRVITGGRH